MSPRKETLKDYCAPHTSNTRQRKGARFYNVYIMYKTVYATCQYKSPIYDFLQFKGMWSIVWARRHLYLGQKQPLMANATLWIQPYFAHFLSAVCLLSNGEFLVDCSHMAVWKIEFLKTIMKNTNIALIICDAAFKDDNLCNSCWKKSLLKFTEYPKFLLVILIVSYNIFLIDPSVKIPF